jgi:hypothetical protein
MNHDAGARSVAEHCSPQMLLIAGIQLFSSKQHEASESEDEQEEEEQGEHEHDSDDENAERANSNKHASTSAPGAGDGLIDPGCPIVNTRDPLEAANVVRKHYRIKARPLDQVSGL